MTHEEFAHMCLSIKKGNVDIPIPCCANCKYYVEHPDGGVIYKNGEVIKEVTLPSWWACCHPALNDEEEILYMQPEDFCSRFEQRKD